VRWGTLHDSELKAGIQIVGYISPASSETYQDSVKNCRIHIPLLEAAALLHDIDKSVPKLTGEEHPDTAVRLLREEGMDEVAEAVKTHPLHAILNSMTAPATREEKLLFLADKMVKYEILTVDRRFALWRKEDLSKEARATLDLSYPEVKHLEAEVFARIGILPEQVAKLA
jgi:HD superfamily phosphodiesterase